MIRCVFYILNIIWPFDHIHTEGGREKERDNYGKIKTDHIIKIKEYFDLL